MRVGACLDVAPTCLRRISELGKGGEGRAFKETPELTGGETGSTAVLFIVTEKLLVGGGMEGAFDD